VCGGASNLCPVRLCASALSLPPRFRPPSSSNQLLTWLLVRSPKAARAPEGAGVAALAPPGVPAASARWSSCWGEPAWARRPWRVEGGSMESVWGSWTVACGLPSLCAGHVWREKARVEKGLSATGLHLRNGPPGPLPTPLSAPLTAGTCPTCRPRPSERERSLALTHIHTHTHTHAQPLGEHPRLPACSRRVLSPSRIDSLFSSLSLSPPRARASFPPLSA